MAELALIALAALFVGLAGIDVYVARRLLRAARRRPYIPALTGIAVVSVTVTVGMTIGAVLGIGAVWRLGTRTTLIPADLGVILLIAALAVPSSGLVYQFRQLRGWGRMARNGRRITDVPPPAAPTP